MNHVMIDLETLGTTADSVILSIGAVKFDLDSGSISDDGFYSSISVDSNLDSKRRVSEATLLWWLKQPAAAQQVFFEPKDHLEDALIRFSEFFDHDNFTVWSNGADFDIPMLTHAFGQFGLSLPWKFYNTRCFRTYKGLPGAKNIRFQTGVKHNAMADAYSQAKTVTMIHKALFEKETHDQH